MEPEFVLEMRNISKAFPGVQALDDVTLKVRAGSVHALMGENGAGKSTLMKCLFGIYKEDAGDIFVHGAKVNFHSTKDALENKVSMIHQELSNVPERSVAENLWLGREPVRRIGPFTFVDRRRMFRDTQELMRTLEMNIRPDSRMGSLSISQQQAAEIAKAVSYNASVLVMDEPTSSLTETETSHLFSIIRGLRSRGVAVIYISHKMSEIFQIADEISVMRDGKLISTQPAERLNDDSLIRLMVGRDMSNRFPPVESVPGGVCLKVSGLTAANPSSFKDISFELHRGEILGIGGLVGAQRSELVEAIFGLRGIASGSVCINGCDVELRSPRDAIGAGIGLITEDRRNSGIFPLMSITSNTAIPSLDQFLNRFGTIDHPRLRTETARMNTQLRTRAASWSTLVEHLSGGNQQKVIVARWLLISPGILIMDEPTRGIDVGTKYEIYLIMADLARKGTAIIMVSSEMPELIGMSHRILVLCNGRMTGILDKKDATQESVMRLAAMFS